MFFLFFEGERSTRCLKRRSFALPYILLNAALLLCMEEAGWITGQVIFADGGASLLNAEVPPEIQFG